MTIQEFIDKHAARIDKEWDFQGTESAKRSNVTDCELLIAKALIAACTQVRDEINNKAYHEN